MQSALIQEQERDGGVIIPLLSDFSLGVLTVQQDSSGNADPGCAFLMVCFYTFSMIAQPLKYRCDHA